MNRQVQLLLELGSVEDDLALQLTRCYGTLAEAARHVRDPAMARVVRVTAHIAEVSARAARLRAVVLDELFEDIAAETTMLTVPRPAKGRRGRQGARP